jgi:GTP:adenosylcobinamide-phosphate guanylyltransferase
MSLPAIVLAGERAGGNALARHFDLPSGVLVEVAGRPCISRVIDTLNASESIEGGLICGPEEGVQAASPVFQEILENSPFTWLQPAEGPAESALASLDALKVRPVLLTAADHALLTPEIVDGFCNLAMLSEADFIVGLVPYARVREAFPESKRTVLQFSDGQYCGSNLFLIRTEAGRHLLEFWRTIAQHRKKPWRMASEIGVTTLLSYLTGRLSLADTLDRISDKAGCRVAHVEILAPQAAVDVDSLADHALAERILTERILAEQIASSC